ncbi:hypothetical protein Taro_041125 [Colocasia esculenta]|uniref:Uncharacterized protein n=1 Tax=Colocasia esculenta TaxID=4460 RepID=A0A843WDJ6_COLES|nr:hypothetical protein [Colocasia esculenta]
MQSNVCQSLETTDTSTFNFQNEDINRRLKLQIDDECEGRPGGIQGVVPFSVKEDLVVSRGLFPSCEGRPAGVLGVVVSLRETVVGLRGLAVQAQSTHWFTVCERDKVGCRVINVTALGVAFLILPFVVFVCMSTACRTPGGLLTSTVGRRRPPMSRSCHGSRVHRVLNCEVLLAEFDRTELSKLCSARKGCCGGFLGAFGRCFRHGFAARTSHGAEETLGGCRSLCSSRR